MAVKYSCLLDVNEDNRAEHDVSSAMQSFHYVRSMDMVARIQTVGHLDAVFESDDADFRKLFKHGRRIVVRSRPARYANPSFNDPYMYVGYIREVRRLREDKFSVAADFALDWLHDDDDTATYVNFAPVGVIIDALFRASVSAPWHQVVVNPRGLVPGTYDYAVVGKSAVGDTTLVGAYYPRGHFEGAQAQWLRRVDAIVLDVDSADKSGSLFSLLAKAILSEAGYLFVEAGGRYKHNIAFRGRYGKTFARAPEYSSSLTSWDDADSATWDERVTELTVLSPNRVERQGALFKTLRNFHVPAGSSFFQFESYIDGFPVGIEGNVRVEGLPDDVQCFPSFNGFHLYLQFENTGRDLAIIDELSVYADVVQIQSVSRRLARTGFRGGRQAVLEFANLAGYEDVLLSHYIRGLQAQNELGAIYLTTGQLLIPARHYDLMNIIDLNDGDVNESAYIQSIEWTYDEGISTVKLGLWPFVDYNYGLVGKTGFDKVGQVVVGI